VKTRLKIFVVALFALIVIVSCAACSGGSPPTALRDSESQSGYNGPYVTTTASAGRAVPPRATVPPATTSPASMNWAPAVPAPGGKASGVNYSGDSYTEISIPDRMIVRTGDIILVVSDVPGTLDNIAAIAKDNGGYVVTSQKWKEGERNIGSISIRVLAENYDRTISALRSLAMSVVSESNSSQDVTEEYTDTDARVKNLEATETRLLEILKGATVTEDVLSIQREITSVRGQIEQAKARMLYLERTSSTSLINIRLNEAVIDLKFTADNIRTDAHQKVVFTAEVSGGFAPYSYLWDFGDGETSIEKSPSHAYNDKGAYSITLKVTDDKGYTNELTRSEYINVVGGWNPGSVARSAWEGLGAFGRVLVNILIWIGILSPVWIVIGAVIWFFVWRRKRQTR